MVHDDWETVYTDEFGPILVRRMTEDELRQARDTNERSDLSPSIHHGLWCDERDAKSERRTGRVILFYLVVVFGLLVWALWIWAQRGSLWV